MNEKNATRFWKSLSNALSIIIFSFTFVAFLLTYRNVIADKFNLTTDTVYLSGTGSMYPTFPKGEGKTYTQLRKEIVGAPQMNRYPSGFELFGKRFFSYELQRGDIVSFKNEKTIEITQKEGDPTGFVKRIIALPGDRIELKDGNVYLNGQILLEPYIARARSTFGDITLKECSQLTIPDGYVFVMGDNRKGSLDSRHELGLIKVSDIDHVIPFEKQIGTLDKNWRDTSKDTDPSSRISINKELYLQKLNQKRTQANVPPLTYSKKLENSATLRGINILKFDDKSFEATKSGYTQKKALEEVSYKNVLWGEIAIYGHYDEEELLENQFAFHDSKTFLLNKDFQDIGISEVNQDINNCPTQIIVIHLGGYVPPNYSKDEIEVWRNIVNNLENVSPSWKELEKSGQFYLENKTKIDRINELIALRLQIARNILLSLEKNEWLTDEQKEWIRKDKDFFEELNNLIKEMNSN